MSKPLNRENITAALAVALRDQSQTHQRDDHAVILRFLTEIERTSWIEMALEDYEDACCTIEGSASR